MTTARALSLIVALGAGHPGPPPTDSISQTASGTRLVTAVPCPVTGLVGELFANEIAGGPGSPQPGGAELAGRLVAIWSRHIEADRELRAAEARALDQANQQALAAITDPASQDREPTVARFLALAASTAKAQLGRARRAVLAMADEAGAARADPARLASAVQFAQGLVALQQGCALVNGNALPAADVDLCTTVHGMLARPATPGQACTDAERATVCRVLRDYVLAVGPVQAQRLDAAAAVGAHGNEPGQWTAPASERRHASAAAWRVFTAQMEWFPRILDALPRRLRDEAEPELFTIVAPEQFPDEEGMGPVLAACAAREGQPAERADEVRRLANWFHDAYAAACREVIHAYMDERNATFGLGRRPEASMAVPALDDALARRSNVNAMAAQSLRAIDPGLDVEAERRKAASDAMQLEGMILRRQQERLGRNPLP